MEWMQKFPQIKQSDQIGKLENTLVICPQQQNQFDCGIYLLQYVESFFTVLFFYTLI